MLDWPFVLISLSNNTRNENHKVLEQHNNISLPSVCVIVVLNPTAINQSNIKSLTEQKQPPMA